MRKTRKIGKRVITEGRIILSRASILREVGKERKLRKRKRRKKEEKERLSFYRV
jgi:hypothetical protein